MRYLWKAFGLNAGNVIKTCWILWPGSVMSRTKKKDRPIVLFSLDGVYCAHIQVKKVGEAC